MLDVLPPPLIGFEKPAIIRRATPDLLPVAGMLPGVAPVVHSRPRPQFVGMTGVFSTDPSTVAAVNVGPAYTKWVHFGISWSAGTSRTLDSVTFGGVACARDVRGLVGSTTANLEWWSIQTALAIGDLVMDWSGSISGGIAAVFWGPRTGTLTTATGSDAGAGSATTTTTTCNTFAGGYLLAGARWNGARTTTWTGATEVYDAGGFESFAMLPITATETGRTITATWPSAVDVRRIAVLAVQ
jgi:hypothetical protein